MMIKQAIYNPLRLSAALSDLKSKGIAKTAELTKRAALLVLFYLLLGSAYANNIRVTNASLVDINTTANTANVRFDLTWKNSWRVTAAPSNWDAAWVFVKYRVGTGPWMHAFLNDTGHTAGTGTGTTISAGLVNTGLAFNSTTNPAVGVFIHRSAAGTGTFTQTGIKLRWNYGANGVADLGGLEIKVFAIEMVYVAQGAFYVGSGGTETRSFTDGSWVSGASIPFRITSENAINIGQSPGNLWGFSAIGNPGVLSAAFPKGFAAFYSMKYELSQQQYVDFLNTLTRGQQNTRTLTDLSTGITSVLNRYVMTNTSTVANRNGISTDVTIHTSDPLVFYCDLNENGIGGEALDGQWIAINFLSWMDGSAYLDWSGLRPITELEFEKALRGPATPVPNEYAWGTNQIASLSYTTNNSGSANEGIATNYSTSAGNALFLSTRGSIGGPLRVGAVAANGLNTGRVTSGASYWGIMELSGNVWERAVSVGSDEGRLFTGANGDGDLSSNGNANVAAWPGLVDGEVTLALGSGYRGGNWAGGNQFLPVSDRNFATNTATDRFFHFGIRGVRSAP